MTSDLYSCSIDRYLELASAPTPTPGGGSVSAVVATSAAAMVCMVANLTVNKKGLEGFWDAARDLSQQGENVLSELKTLTAKDIAAFEQFMAVYKLPKTTEEEKKYRAEAIQAEAKHATDVPLAIARACLKILVLAEKLAPFGNKSAVSDVGVAACVASGALEAALFSVDVNLVSISDQSFVKELLHERKLLLQESRALREKTVIAVQERIGITSLLSTSK